MLAFFLSLFLSSFIVAGEAPEGQLPKAVKPLHYDLKLEINPKSKKFSGNVSIRIRLDKATKEFWMHGEKLDVKTAEIISGNTKIPVTYTQVTPEGVVRIDAPEVIKTGEATLHLGYSASYRSDLSGLYQVTQNGYSYIYSQFEPIAARSTFPCFDEPRFKTPFKISMTIPQNDSGVSNNPVIKETKHTNKTKTLEFSETPALPTYLLAFLVGPFDIIKHDNFLRGITPKGQGHRIAYALRETPKILKLLENYFGTSYPFEKLDIIAVPDFAAGAMENPGAITFRDSLLLIDAKHAPVNQLRRFADVMAHELAHQWFGNLVTMAWWEDLWLNEAFATWMASKIMQEYNPAYHADWDLIAHTQYAMNEDSLQASRKIKEPILSHHDIYSAFDGITYTKGAAVIAMFEQYLTSGVFQKGIRSYLTKYSRGTADTNDFISELSKASEQNLAPSFGSFLTQPGVPLLKFTGDQYRQTRYLPFGSSLNPHETWQIPFCPEQGGCQLLRSGSGTLSNFGFPSRNGLGYYRFSGDYPANSESIGDQIAQIANLNASFNAGMIDTKTALTQLGVFTQKPYRQLATAPMSLLSWLKFFAVPDSDALTAYAKTVYSIKPSMNEPDEQRLFDVAYLDFMATVVEDSKTRLELVQKGLEFLKNPNSIPSDTAPLALEILIQEKPQLFIKLTQKLAKTTDAIQRGALLRGMAESDKALDFVLSPLLKKNEMLSLLNSYMSTPEDAQKGLSWLEKNLANVLRVLPEKASAHLPSVAGNLCSEPDAKRLEILIKPVAQGLPGAPRALAETLEEIRLCAALVKQQKPAATKFLGTFTEK